MCDELYYYYYIYFYCFSNKKTERETKQFRLSVDGLIVMLYIVIVNIQCPGIPHTETRNSVFDSQGYIDDSSTQISPIRLEINA